MKRKREGDEGPEKKKQKVCSCERCSKGFEECYSCKKNVLPCCYAKCKGCGVFGCFKAHGTKSEIKQVREDGHFSKVVKYIQTDYFTNQKWDKPWSNNCMDVCCYCSVPLCGKCSNYCRGCSLTYCKEHVHSEEKRCVYCRDNENDICMGYWKNKENPDDQEPWGANCGEKHCNYCGIRGTHREYAPNPYERKKKAPKKGRYVTSGSSDSSSSESDSDSD